MNTFYNDIKVSAENAAEILVNFFFVIPPINIFAIEVPVSSLCHFPYHVL